MIQLRLLVTSNNDTENAHILYAEFHDDTLTGICRATHRIKADWPTIYHTTFTFKPFKTFYDRIINELLGGAKYKKQDTDVGFNTAAEDLRREMTQIERDQIE